MLEIHELTGGWGQTTIVEGVSFEVKTGEALAIVGRNGVGKTTTLELLMGRALLRSGSIRLDGKDVSAATIHERNRLGFGYVPQNREVFPSLTVLENLLVAVRPGFWTMARLLELFPSLAKRSKSYAGQLSGGEQQMLSVARALIGNPKVLLMDEPTEGLAPIVVEQMVEALHALAETRTMAILLVEQIVEVALDVSNRCLVLDRGQVIHEAQSEALLDNPSELQGLMGFEPHPV